MNGYGYENYKGVILEGTFKDYNLNGFGSKKCDEYSYEGQFHEGKRHEWGVCREDDIEYEAIWQNDDLVSKINYSLFINKMKQERFELG